MHKLLDGFTFFNELNTLELRLRELAPLVHRFIIVESDTTFTGQPKPLHFQLNRSRFGAWLDKIEHVVVRDMPGEGASAWDRESHQRNAIRRGLGSAAPTDLVLIGDVDEIPKPSALKTALEDPGSSKAITTFAPELFLYYFNLRSDPPYVTTLGPRMIACRYLRQPEMLRKHKPQWRKGNVGALSRVVLAARIVTKYGVPLANRLVHRGAWHFTFQGGAEAIRRKLQSYSHTEMVRPEHMNLKYLETMLRNRQFIFEGELDLAVVEDPEELPLSLVVDPVHWRETLAPGTVLPTLKGNKLRNA